MAVTFNDKRGGHLRVGGRVKFAQGTVQSSAKELRPKFRARRGTLRALGPSSWGGDEWWEGTVRWDDGAEERWGAHHLAMAKPARKSNPSKALPVKAGNFPVVPHSRGWRTYRLVQKRGGQTDKSMVFFAPDNARAREYAQKVTFTAATPIRLEVATATPKAKKNPSVRWGAWGHSRNATRHAGHWESRHAGTHSEYRHLDDEFRPDGWRITSSTGTVTVHPPTGASYQVAGHVGDAKAEVERQVGRR